jgi:hypothetical protein
LQAAGLLGIRALRFSNAAAVIATLARCHVSMSLNCNKLPNELEETAHLLVSPKVSPKGKLETANPQRSMEHQIRDPILHQGKVPSETLQHSWNLLVYLIDGQQMGLWLKTWAAKESQSVDEELTQCVRVTVGLRGIEAGLRGMSNIWSLRRDDRIS